MFLQKTTAAAAAVPSSPFSCSKATTAMGPKWTKGSKKNAVAKPNPKKKVQDKLTNENTPSSSDGHETRPAKRPKREHPAKPTETTTAAAGEASRPSWYKMPDHPTDNFEGSMRLSIHSVFSRRLEDCLKKLEADYQAAVASAKAVQETVVEWKAAWESGM